MSYSNIDKPSKYFDTVLNTGDNTSPKSITGFGFQPDLVWSKTRTSANNHTLFDVVRGAGSNKELMSNSTSAEGGGATGTFGYISAFNTDGFTATAGSTNSAYLNNSGDTYVNWGWKANGAGVSNTQGSITSTVSANTTSGFSIVSYTGNGTAGATVGHGIGSTVGMILLKGRSFVDNWAVYHKSIGGTGLLELNGTGGTNTVSTRWNNTNAGATVFTLGNNSQVNGNGSTYIAYCFAEVKGFSKFGSYTGNGSTDGTFVYTGFSPAFILVKNTTTAGNSWAMFDNKRLGYNVSNLALFPSDSSAETSGTSYIDILSNGFKMRSTNDFNNKSGDTYIYMAFAENPFVSSKGIPCTAR